ncbi:hypothetical protein JN531_009525 [Flagellatimonas centrodinii]|uniref:hypothetical protein n=1 Tax=Flagellatimonas centrodinii TaxID=2806210 RepID=UPI001FEDCE59|nr:hypothetical protein [Flagellatimonas centrodinii]ULQ45368.1 hypothetical protein JN531_009525 [Flagellatimonas centrodinii]
MANDNLDDVDHLMKALSLDGVRYRDFSGRAHPPKLKLIGGRREALPAESSAASASPTEAPRSAPFMPPQVVPPTAPPVAAAAPATPVVPTVTPVEPVALPDESLQATFSRLIARAPAPQPRKLKLELQLPPRQPAAPAPDVTREQPTLGSLFDRLSGRPGLTTPKKIG